MADLNDLFATQTVTSDDQHSLQHPLQQKQQQQQTVMLASAIDLNEFRQQARRLLAAGVAPGQVSWRVSSNNGQADGDTSGAEAAASVPVPAGFLALCQHLILHRDASRFELMYRLLWRLVHEPGLRHNPQDADRVLAGQMAQAVQEDMQRMKTSLRFQTLEDEAFHARPLDGPLHVAWFEPEHHIVEAITPFFARRFTRMRWAILTPERCVEWKHVNQRPPSPGKAKTATETATRTAAAGQPLFSPGASKNQLPAANAGKQVWLKYYQQIFVKPALPRRVRHKAAETAAGKLHHQPVVSRTRSLHYQ